MTSAPVEWVLVIFYGPSAHRATYGRLPGTSYTKDYIQLTNKILEATTSIFSEAAGPAGDVPLRYEWPGGEAAGALVNRSSDRPHLKWETKVGAPKAWKMALAPSLTTAETIPGDPSHLSEGDADNEYKLLPTRGAGQPYLVAVKLRDEPNTLHVRAYLRGPSKKFAWADLSLAPESIQALAAETSKESALAWRTFDSGGYALNADVRAKLAQLDAHFTPSELINALDASEGRALAEFLRQPGYGLFFDPTKNHDCWVEPVSLENRIVGSIAEAIGTLSDEFAGDLVSDAAAEALAVDPTEVDTYRDQIENKDYRVADTRTSVKTRGSAQRAFAERVKSNYGFRCAITGVTTRDFLVAAHVVPWSEDESVRLDPSNGICLSLLVDRAFEKGYLRISDDYLIQVDWHKVGGDQALKCYLDPFDGARLSLPTDHRPSAVYLRRRRQLLGMAD